MDRIGNGWPPFSPRQLEVRGRVQAVTGSTKSDSVDRVGKSIMEVQFTPELERKLNDLASLTGRGAGELVQDAVAGLVELLGN